MIPSSHLYVVWAVVSMAAPQVMECAQNVLKMH